MVDYDTIKVKCKMCNAIRNIPVPFKEATSIIYCTSCGASGKIGSNKVEKITQ